MFRLMLIACLLLVAGGSPAKAPDRAAPARGSKDAVFSEDFENYDRKRWDEISDEANAVAVVDGGPSGNGKCVQITHGLGQNTGGHLYKMLGEGLDTCHLRF